MKIKVGFDIDAVFANFVKTFTSFANKEKGTPIINHSTERKSWFLKNEYPLSEEEIKELWEKFLEIENIYEEFELEDEEDFKAFLDFVKKHNTKVEVFFITARRNTKKGKHVIEQTKDWFKKHGYENANVHIAFEKGSKAKELELDYFIDDKHTHIEEVLKACKKTKAYLLNKPYNEEFELPRVYSLKEFLRNIENDILLKELKRKYFKE